MSWPDTQARSPDADIAELLAALEVRLDAGHLERALTHRSFAYENGGLPTNERLEFLGDSVLSMIVTDTLFRGYPDLAEGQLAKLRAAVVNMRTLAGVARGLRLGEYVRLGRGEEGTGGRDKSSILADTLEAVIGAVYLDRGLAEAASLVHRLFDSVIARSAGLGAGLDWKTSLQELAASEMLGVPEYHVLESGPDHQKSFHASVRIGAQTYGEGVARSKKEAEQMAAEAAWNAISNGIPGSEHSPSGGGGIPDPEASAGPEVETPESRLETGLRLDSKRARDAAGWYEVASYSRVNDALIVLLDPPSTVPERDIGPAPVESSIAVNAYLGTDDRVLADSVLEALDAVARQLGYEGPYDKILESGSIFRQARARLKAGIDSDDAVSYRAKLEHAVELLAIGERQATVNQKEAEALSRVLASLNDIPSACLQVGSTLIVKFPDSQGAVVLVRPLSALELRTLERFPGILKDPRRAIETLATAVMNVETVDESGS